MSAGPSRRFEPWAFGAFAIAAATAGLYLFLGSRPGVGEARLEDGAWSLATSEVHLAVPALLAHLSARGAALSHLTTHSATLEDVFVELTGRHLRDA